MRIADKIATSITLNILNDLISHISKQVDDTKNVSFKEVLIDICDTLRHLLRLMEITYHE